MKTDLNVIGGVIFWAALTLGWGLSGTRQVCMAEEAGMPVIKRAPAPLVIDGHLEDAWFVAAPIVINQAKQVVLTPEGGVADFAERVVSKYWQGPQMLSGKIYLLMDEQNLYLAADVTDNHPLVNQFADGGIFDGSNIELYFAAKDRKDYPEISTPGYAPFEYQVQLGLDKDGKGTIWFGPQAPSSERGTSHGPAVGGQLAAVKRPDGTGYVLEVKIPLENFRFQPKMGQKIAFDIGLNHAAGQPGKDGKIHRDIQMMWRGDCGNCANSIPWARGFVWAAPLPGQGAAQAKIPSVQATVRVAGNTAFDVNGSADIPQDVFGIRSQWWTKVPEEKADYSRWMQAAGFTSYFFYSYPSHLSREWEDPTRPGHAKTEVFQHPERALGNASQLPDGTYTQVWQKGASFFLCLASGPDWMALNPVGTHYPVPADPQEYARISSALLSVLRTDPRGPGKRFNHVSFMNEPEYIYDWDSKDFQDDPTMPTDNLLGQKGLDYYIKTFTTLSKQLKSDFPGLQVGGPVAHGPLQMLDWWDWKNWTIKFIDQTGSFCDYYDFHPYADWNNDRASIQAQVTMIMNYVLNTQKRPMKSALSEQCYYGAQALVNDPGQRFQQLLWNQRVLFMLLDHPDKVVGYYYFLIGDPRGPGSSSFTLQNMLYLKDGKLAPYPIMLLYLGMRELRGARLYAESSHPDVLVRAALNRNKLNALVFNDGNQQANVGLTLDLPPDAKIVRILSSGWDYNRSKNEFAHFEDREITGKASDGKLSLPVTLSPFASQSFVVEFASDTKPGLTVKSKEYYADRIFAEQAAETKPVFKIGVPASELKDANDFFLRLGWDGPKPDGVMVGATRYAIPAPRQEITDIHVAEIPLKMTDVSATTNVKPIYDKTYPDYNEKALFATLVVKNRLK